MSESTISFSFPKPYHFNRDMSRRPSSCSFHQACASLLNSRISNHKQCLIQSMHVIPLFKTS